jgi:hypothetical protein
MNDHPRRVGENLDAELFAGVTSADLPPQPQLVPDSAAEMKAVIVLRALMNAGLKQPFGFDVDEAKVLWGSRLGSFHVDVLLEAIGDWIGAPGGEFPSVGDVETVASSVVRRNHAESPAERARTARVCRECDGVRYVRVVTGTQIIPVGKDMVPTEVQTSAMRPCPVCPEMAEKSELWDRGHFDAEHADRGGCPKCWRYMPSQAHRVKKEKVIA